MADKIVKVKNNTQAQKTWCGKVLEASEEYTLPTINIPTWCDNETFFAAVGNDEALLGDGTNYFGAIEGWSWLSTSLPEVIRAYTDTDDYGQVFNRTKQDDRDITVGHYRAIQFISDIVATSGWQTFEKKFCIPYDVLSSFSQFYDENLDDKIDVVFFPETTIGALTASAAIGDNHLHVNSTVFLYLSEGYWVHLGDEIFDCLSMDATAGTINIGKSILTGTESQKVLANNYNAGTAVKFSAPMMTSDNIDDRGFLIVLAEKCELGATAYGSSGIPANTIMRLRYYNTDGAAKKVRVVFEGYMGKLKEVL